MKYTAKTRTAALLASIAVTLVLLESVALIAHPAVEPTTRLAAAGVSTAR